MKTEVPHLDANSSIIDALKMMYAESVGCLPILDRDQRVSAIVTEQDFMRLIADRKVGVAIHEYMSANVTTVEPDVEIGTAGKLMVDNKFRRLPVVKNGILLGIATAFDMLRFLGSGEAFIKGAGGIEDALGTPVKSLITRDVVWTTSDRDLGEVAGMMAANNVGSIPIIDQGVLTGIVTERDVVRALATLK
jgi:CBS domain-containing protein